MLPEGHELASLKEIHAKDLRGVPLILIGRQRPTRMLLDQTFSREAVKQNVKIETHTNSSACSYVAPRSRRCDFEQLLCQSLPALPIVQRPFVPVTTQEFALATPSGTSASLAAKALMEALKRQIQISQKHAIS